MKKLAGIACNLILLSTCFAQRATDVEMLFKEDGSVVVAKSKEDCQLAWAQMVIRGTHRRDYIPFVQSLYEKYYYRVIYTQSGFDTVSADGMNFREHQESQNAIVRAFDVEKVNWRTDLAKVWRDIRAVRNIANAFRDDEEKSWPWGRQEIIRYNRGVMRAVPASLADSLRNNPRSWEIAQDQTARLSTEPKQIAGPKQVMEVKREWLRRRQ